MSGRVRWALCAGLPVAVLVGTHSSRAAPTEQPDPLCREIARHAREFPLLKPAKAPDGKPRLIRLQLNHKPLIIRGVRRDGFRFATPVAPSSFGWAFQPTQNLGAWLTFPVDRPDDQGRHGFREFFRETARAGAMLAPKGGTRGAGQETLVQSVPKGRLLPQSTYIVLFEFDDEQPASVNVRFTFSPKVVTSERAIGEILGVP
jgi:hypothetical protein